LGVILTSSDEGPDDNEVDQAWQSVGEEGSDHESERDSCLDEELEIDDPEILVALDGQALTQKLASEVSANGSPNLPSPHVS
jgi:hypothetical protein